MYTATEILEIFYNKHGDLVKEMQDSDHNCNGRLNPYHMEGDVWTHTMSVFSHAISKNVPMEVLFSALLHDIGKPRTREVKFDAKRGWFTRFTGHEGLSFYMAITVLKSYPKLDTQQRATILELIASHSHLFDISKKESPERMYAGRQEFYDMLVQMVECDTLGRVSQHQNNVKSSDVIEKLKSVKVNEFEMPGLAPTMCLLVGPPGSGKSRFPGIETSVSRDDVVMELGGKDSYNECWRSVDQKAVDTEFRKRVQALASEGKSFIVDRCHMSKKSRRDVLAIAKDKGYNTKCVVLLTEIERVLKQNENRDKTIKPDVILGMIRAFHYPTRCEVNDVVLV